VDPANFGESSFDNALPWINIKAANYAPVGDLTDQIPILLARHQIRILNDKGFQYLVEDIFRVKQLRKKNVISLNEADRRKERSAQEKRLSARVDGAGQAVARAAGGALQDDGLQVDERTLTKELAAEDTKKSAKDVLLNEAVNILGDALALQKNNFKLATRITSTSPVMVMELVPQN
jgi:carboxyl-terminal processing protease